MFFLNVSLATYIFNKFTCYFSVVKEYEFFSSFIEK